MKKRIVVAFSVILVAVLVLVGVVLGRTVGFISSQLDVAPVAPVLHSTYAQRQ